MQQKIPTTAGNLKVSEEVVSTIVKQVAQEMEGVHSLAAPPVSFKDMVVKSGVQRPIRITLNGDVAMIDISLVLKLGYQVRAVAEKLQNDVKEEVQNMAGITVSAVNVYVANVVAAK